jgi:soluble lytic murein transglycosylase
MKLRSKVAGGVGAVAGALVALSMGMTGVDASRSVGLLSDSLAVGHGIPLDISVRDAARALGEARTALDAGDAERAAAALARARESSLLADALRDYVAYYDARLLGLRGQYTAAASAAAEAVQRHPDTLLGSQLSRLRGDALAAAGDEAGARVSWNAALLESTDLDRRRALKLAIVESRKRSGEIEQAADNDQLIDTLFAESALPAETPAGQRSAAMALLAADDLMSKGRGELASEAYREALGGSLPADERRHAQMQLGLALFRLRRYEEAIASFDVLGRGAEARFWYARSSARAGRVRRAIDVFEQLAASAPAEYASRSAYLAGLLLEDRGEVARALAHYEKVASYEQFAERSIAALWRIGWSAWHRGDYAAARTRFEQMIEREADPIAGLRARYWAARAVQRSGQPVLARRELDQIGRDYPLAYYGWRAQEQLGDVNVLAREQKVAPVRSRTSIPERDLRRIALLLEAGIDEGARRELQPLAVRARTMADHVTVGQLLAGSGDYFSAQRLVVDAYSVPLSQGLREGNERLWWLSWPPAYREIVERSVPEESAIDAALVWAIMREESGFRPEVMSSAGAMGLLQLMPETAERMARMSGQLPFEAETLFAPETNIALGSYYLDHLAGRFPERLSAAISSYNAGPSAVSRWLQGDAAKLEDDVWVEDIPYDQTQSYVKRVLRSLHVYRTFY